MPIFSSSDLPYKLIHRGKVRDSYMIDDHRRLIISTDRLSAFDRVLHQVPYKGQVLNQLSAWWFSKLADIIPNHLLSVPDENAMIAVNTKPILVEVVVRAYLSGQTQTALWYRYSLGERNIYGYNFPDGMKKNQALAKPIITPTTKGGLSGHDERLTCQQVLEHGLLDQDTWEIVKNTSLALFKRGQELALVRGLILVDTKYEFGIDHQGRLLLIDEVHTPDSSRFWKAGLEIENYDKEMIRLAYDKLGFRGNGEPPILPDDLWQSLSERYIKIYEMLSGHSFVPGVYPVNARLCKNLEDIL